MYYSIAFIFYILVLIWVGFFYIPPLWLAQILIYFEFFDESMLEMGNYHVHKQHQNDFFKAHADV